MALVKVVLEEILVYWQSLAHIPKVDLEKIRKTSINFLWSAKEGSDGFLWTNWKYIAKL